MFSFESRLGSNFPEGSEGGVTVRRNEIQPARPVTVFVTTQLFTGDITELLDREYLAGAEGTS